jgi:hypothetical protein
MPGYGLFGRIGATGSTATFAGISPIGFVLPISPIGFVLPISVGGFGRPISPGGFGRPIFAPVALVRQNAVDAAALPTRALWRRMG